MAEYSDNERFKSDKIKNDKNKLRKNKVEESVHSHRYIDIIISLQLLYCNI